MTTFIYALCEPGTRTVRYIGKTKDLKSRLSQHCRKPSATLGTHLGHWLGSLRSLSKKPEMVFLSEVTTDLGPEEEIRYISAARMLGMNLVNSTDGGEGVTATPETRGKMRAAWKLRSPVSDETRAKMSAAHKGRVKSLEERAKLSMALKGRAPSAECIAKGIAANKGRIHSAEARANMSAAGRGRIFSDEHRANLSAAGRGRPVSPETRMKIGAARKASLKQKGDIS